MMSILLPTARSLLTASAALLLAVAAQATEYLPAPETTQAGAENCERSPRCNGLLNGKPNYRAYEAEVLRVVDGDTIEARVHLWPNQSIVTLVRVRGLQAPEIRGAEPCERSMGEAAKAWVENKYDQTWVLLENVRAGGLGYRMEADVSRWNTQRFVSLAEEVAEAGLGVAASRGDDAPSWCAGEGN